MCIQIMPQLLHYFHVENEPDSLDWATIIVYTCQGSCDRNVSYKEEFVLVQLQEQTYRGMTLVCNLCLVNFMMCSISFPSFVMSPQIST
jgi:hypothetical protein